MQHCIFPGHFHASEQTTPAVHNWYKEPLVKLIWEDLKQDLEDVKKMHFFSDFVEDINAISQ